jgi:hypothetical protein
MRPPQSPGMSLHITNTHRSQGRPLLTGARGLRATISTPEIMIETQSLSPMKSAVFCPVSCVPAPRWVDCPGAGWFSASRFLFRSKQKIRGAAPTYFSPAIWKTRSPENPPRKIVHRTPTEAKKQKASACRRGLDFRMVFDVTFDSPIALEAGDSIRGRHVDFWLPHHWLPPPWLLPPCQDIPSWVQ